MPLVKSLSRVMLAGIVGIFMTSFVAAQGVVLKLPADGTWVRYEGTYTQTEIRPDSPLGKLEIPPWLEHVTIKSVGSAEAAVNGETVACRWIEIKIERGREEEGKVNPGTTGLEIYKVLVPVAAITVDPVVEPGVPIGYLPIIKGARVVGQSEPKPLTEPALKLYPLAVLFGYCRDMKVEEQSVDPGTGLGAVAATNYAGTMVLERSGSRTTMDINVWSSSDVPFGVAAWKAKIVRAVKDAQASRDSFTPLTQIDVELKAQVTGENAMSEVDFE
jgi:hypothetical protein